ncbi:MAG: CDP-alcohol phosphatidyltransferase family protein [Butyricicoccaceae bacterium]
MTTANKITLTRIAMIPFFIYFAAQPMLIIDRGNYIVSFPTCTVIALVLFCVASFTDSGRLCRPKVQSGNGFRQRVCRSARGQAARRLRAHPVR